MKRRPHRVKFGHRSVETRKIRFFRRTLLAWWHSSRRPFPWRCVEASNYHHIVSEVLLQRTKAETVAAFWPTFISRFPSWETLAAANVTEVEEVLRPIGLAKQRAPRLHGLATVIASKKGRFPRSRKAIESLPGVGQYIANAVLLFCHDKPHPLLDVNMARVMERFFGERKLADIRYDPYLQSLASFIIRHPNGRILNWSILDFSASVCRARGPLCMICPLAEMCHYAAKRNSTINRAIRLR